MDEKPIAKLEIIVTGFPLVGKPLALIKKDYNLKITNCVYKNKSYSPNANIFMGKGLELTIEGASEDVNIFKLETISGYVPKAITCTKLKTTSCETAADGHNKASPQA